MCPSLFEVTQAAFFMGGRHWEIIEHLRISIHSKISLYSKRGIGGGGGGAGKKSVGIYRGLTMLIFC